MEGTLVQARKYLALGLSVIPLHPKDKRPHLSQWDQYQKRLPKDVELDSWFGQTENNVAVVCGSVSGNLVVIDFDDQQAFNFHFGDTKVLLEGTIVVKTAKGVHIYLRTQQPVKQTTLRAKTDKGPSLPVDIKAEGGYVVAPPSIHPSGATYTFVGKGDAVLELDAETWEKFYNSLKDTAYDWPLAEKLIPLWVPGVRQNLAMGIAGFLRKQMGYDQEKATRFMEALCRATDDNEVRQRISVVQATYQKDVDTVAVRNWLGDGLAEILFAMADGLRLKKKKRKEKEEEEKKETVALWKVGDKIYRCCEREGKRFFACYDRATSQISEVEYIDGPEKLYPIDPQVTGITFPRRLLAYGSPLDLYRRVKKRIDYACSQSGHKNAIVALFVLYHGCIPSDARKNLQIIPMGPAGTGKSAYVDILKYFGDRARVTTSLRQQTNFRLNQLLAGGLEIIDEMPDEDEELEAYIRSRFDPFAVQHRLLDPQSKEKIAGFKVAGPTVVTRRRGFMDDANADRGIIIKCEKPRTRVPLELIDREEDLVTQDMLARFWSEYYDTPVLPTQEELMYDPSVDIVDCRLRAASIYLGKLAKMIGPEAEKDLEDFVTEQTAVRKEMKAITPEGMCIRAIWEFILENVDGRRYSYTHKDGSREKVVDTLSFSPIKGKIAVYLTRQAQDSSDEKDMKLVPFNWGSIALRAGIGREEPAKLVGPHSVTLEWSGHEHSRIKTAAFEVRALDSAFRSFLQDYEPAWVRIFDAPVQATLPTDSPPPPPSSASQQAPIQAPAQPAEKPDSAEKLTELLHDLQMRASPQNFEHEFNILEWAVRRCIEGVESGDPVSAYVLRQEARRKFPDHIDATIRIVDSFFADIEDVAKRIYLRKKLSKYQTTF